MPQTLREQNPHSPGRFDGLPVVLSIGGPLAVVALGLLCYPLATLGLHDAGPFHFAALRAGLAGATLLAIALVLRRPAPRGREVWLKLALVGVFSSALGFTGMFLAAREISPALATILTNLQPLLAALLGHRLLPANLDPRYRVGLGLGFLGVLLMAALPQSMNGLQATPGAVAWVLLGATSGAVGNLLLSQLRGQVDPLAGIGWQYLIAAVILTPLALSESRSIVWTLPFLWSLLALALFSSALATWLWFVLLERMDLNRLNTYTFLLPVGLLVAELSRREAPLSSWQLLGVALVLCAIGLASRNLALPHSAVEESSQFAGVLAYADRERSSDG